MEARAVEPSTGYAPRVGGRREGASSFGLDRRVGRARCAVLAAATVLGAACVNPVDSELVIPESARVRVGPIDAAALESAAKGAPPVLRERGEYLVELLWEAGCLANEIVEPRGTRIPDIVCSLPGRTPHRIVVLAHLDGPVDASGAPRNWRGTALLPFLYQALGVEEREHSFEFAVFGKSPRRRFRDYRERLGSASGVEVRAIVEILNLGSETIGFWSSDAGLSQDFVAASQAVGRPLDSLRPLAKRPFRKRSIPTIAFVSPRGDELPAVGAPRAVGSDTYHSSARLIAFYLGYLDETLRLRAETPAPGTRAR
jgi:hypothetical protein